MVKNEELMNMNELDTKKRSQLKTVSWVLLAVSFPFLLISVILMTRAFIIGVENVSSSLPSTLNVIGNIFLLTGVVLMFVARRKNGKNN